MKNQVALLLIIQRLPRGASIHWKIHIMDITLCRIKVVHQDFPSTSTRTDLAISRRKSLAGGRSSRTQGSSGSRRTSNFLELPGEYPLNILWPALDSPLIILWLSFDCTFDILWLSFDSPFYVPLLTILCFPYYPLTILWLIFDFLLALLSPFNSLWPSKSPLFQYK